MLLSVNSSLILTVCLGILLALFGIGFIWACMSMWKAFGRGDNYEAASYQRTAFIFIILIIIVFIGFQAYCFRAIKMDRYKNAIRDGYDVIVYGKEQDPPPSEEKIYPYLNDMFIDDINHEVQFIR